MFDNREQIEDYDKKTVAVLLHMKVPDDFGRDDIAKSIELLAKTYNEDESTALKVRGIYTGELQMLLEILSTVAKNPAELQLEIKKIVFDLLEISNIDRSRPASSIEIKLAKMDHKPISPASDSKPTSRPNQVDILEQPKNVFSKENMDKTEFLRNRARYQNREKYDINKTSANIKEEKPTEIATTKEMESFILIITIVLVVFIVVLFSYY